MKIYILIKIIKDGEKLLNKLINKSIKNIKFTHEENQMNKYLEEIKNFGTIEIDS